VRALIHELAGAIGAGALDVAGRPLLVRQLQWLRDRGIEDVVVEVAIGPHAVERGALLLGTDPLTARCIVIPTRCAIGAVALAERAGLDDDELFVALPANMVVQSELPLPDDCVSYAFDAPPFAVQQSPAVLPIRTRTRDAESTTESRSGWALRVADPAAAHALSSAILSGEVPGILIHAAEVRRGIWLARGARVAEDATLLPPTLIGANARVFGKARVGPNVIVGNGAVIERESVLSEVAVAPGTLVGEASRVRQAQIDARGITSLADHARTDVTDPLQLTSVDEASTQLGARLAALLLALFVALPWCVAFSITAARGRRIVRKVPWRGRTLHVGTIGIRWLDLLPALADVLAGRRDLVGVALPLALELEGARAEGPTRAGAIDLSAALAPRASTSTLLWMWRWYLQNKTAKLDRALFWQVLSTRPSSPKEQASPP
jgi:carbonic anhydrase/acetyltransferase-like protein (isoleucine patch superfamily)